ncbi:ABC transporter permease [Haloglomus litoreum]|uniref:ABC transporter permease n=1 Tax=Haloglomus litoreum TaxID=3034026 RepID=UPI0023E824E1|nr:ABC transporter permease subunit [Haloglomus sp. DT116]
MLPVARYETERRLLGTLAIAVGLSAFAGLFLAIGPSILEEVDFTEFVDAYPESLQNAFGLDGLGSLAGFLAAELYQFGFVILLGLYFAYLGGGVVAGDIETDRLDMLLSTPISRPRLLLEKFAGLVPSMLIVNAIVGTVVYVGALLVGEPIPLVDILLVHLLSLPYLLVTAAVGLLFSVAFSRSSTAQRGAIAVVFGLFMLETVVTDTDFGALGALSPSRYYDPTAVLVDSSYDLLGAFVLCEAAALLVVLALLRFQERDI